MKQATCRTTRPREAGFSLIELLVTIGIMSILLAAGLPAMLKHTGTIKLKKATDEVVGTLKLARQRAVATSSSVVVQFDLEDANFYVFDDLNENGVRDDGETMAGPYGIPNGIALAEVGFASDRVTFGPRGSASESQAVVLRNAGSNAQRVDVIAASGLIYVSEIYRLSG
jgi:type IV fimbrial biogenesis protein FimT